ncbi:DUF1033 family protein [Enterococcus saccharolyticus]|uniref:Uncharacterized protein n=1 Tax=Enterococcus saccharolyticus subsp. saccharolyticus ATCC 43076 TaxID=1139996 RepID=S0NUJ7_9ENTE|nr:DUF1033 family protein [Enterococcus saccharolyticus]EOT30662.1 hypothetical protein OMQ_00366 [Enterococcus saccharolyticus subsp. saccharolyticus ATCC 43076]EOT80223.1 hypothetical protein I572_00748 [Enterococcus saccharolyticus subsp. saccharolyticus ATCC 43076]
MYQVITMYGDNEPWWFFEEWQADIQEEVTFSTLEEAQSFYRKKWNLVYEEYSYIHAKPNYLSAFWNDGDERWCEECDEDLQQYKGLALLKDYQPLTIESEREFYEATNSSGKTKRCQRSK